MNDQMDPKDESRQPIDDYLDNQMDEPRRDEFEQQINSDDELAGQVDQQRRIDQSLQRLYAPPAGQVLDGLDAAGKKSPKRRSLRARYVAAMLAVAAVIVVGVYLWQIFDTSPGDGLRVVRLTPMAELYAAQIDAGFKPQFVCDTDQQFASTYWYRLDQGLLMHEAPPGVTALGLTYGRHLSFRTIMLLATAEDQQIIVFADQLSQVPQAAPQPPPGMHVHRRDVGELVLYELSPFDQPKLLDLFYQPDMPEAWKTYPKWD